MLIWCLYKYILLVYIYYGILNIITLEGSVEMQELKYYTVNEVMDILKVTRLTIYNYLKSGKLKGNKVAGKWLFTEEQIKEFVKGD